MIHDLINEEMVTTNGCSAKTEVTPESLGYAVGRFAGKALTIWATFSK